MDVALVDHIIVGGDTYFSFSDEKTSNFKPTNQ